jgi:leucyl-tRNA synthetase
MSHAAANGRDPEDSVDEWRVDVGEPAKPVAAPPDSEREWTQDSVSQRRDRVRADLASWNEELAERMRRLEERLDRPRD